MMELQRHLREIHAELDKTVRGEDRHLQLVTKVSISDDAQSKYS